MSALVLLTVLNDLRKRDKVRCLKKFNNTRARMLHYTYNINMTLKLFKRTFMDENVMNLPSFTQRYYGHHYATLLNL